MNEQEKYVRNAVARYRGGSAIGLMKALALVLVGSIGVVLAATGDIFDRSGGAEPSGLLYDKLGPDGAKLAAVGICVLFVLIGIIWATVRARNLTSGVRAYEAALRQEIYRQG